MVIVTNIIYFYSWSVYYSLLTYLCYLLETQSLLFYMYLHFIVLNELLNNHTPSFKEPILI